MTKTTPTAAELHQGRNQAESELVIARQEHAAAAYEFAADRENPKKREAVLNVKQRMDLLEAEILGLKAAAEEAERREEKARREAECAGRLAHVDRAKETLGELERTMKEATTLMAKLGTVRARASEQLQAASEAAHRAKMGFGLPTDYSPFSLGQFDTLWRMSLQKHDAVQFDAFEFGASDVAQVVPQIAGFVEELGRFVRETRCKVEQQFAD